MCATQHRPFLDRRTGRFLTRFLAGICSAAVAVAFAHCAPAKAAPAPISVSDGWFRYITPQVPAAGYMRLSNDSARPVVVMGATSPACGMTMMHRTGNRAGAETMMEVRRVTVPAKGSVAFEPGGFHLMCMQPKMTPGEKVEVTLTLTGGQRVTRPFVVFGATGKPAAR